MAAEPATYDLMLMLDNEAAEDVRRRVVDEVERTIAAEGSLVGRHDWGQRATAYEIDHKSGAEYHLFQLHGPPTLLESLQRTLRIADGVVRFRLIRLAPGTPAPPEQRPEPTAPPARAEAPERSEPQRPAEPPPQTPDAVEAPPPTPPSAPTEPTPVSAPADTPPPAPAEAPAAAG